MHQYPPDDEENDDAAGIPGENVDPDEDDEEKRGEDEDWVDNDDN